MKIRVFLNPPADTPLAFVDFTLSEGGTLAELAVNMIHNGCLLHQRALIPLAAIRVIVELNERGDPDLSNIVPFNGKSVA